MKSDAVQSLKFLRLKRRLRLTTWQAVGVLEALWILTQKSAPAGDIGKFSNEDIAAGVEWLDDANLLIESLVEAGWLDASETHRLVVHDWHDHCPNHIRGGMAKSGREFASKPQAKLSAREEAKVPPRLPPKLPAKDAPHGLPEQAHLVQENEAKLSYSILSYSSQTQPNQTNSNNYTHTHSEDIVAKINKLLDSIILPIPLDSEEGRSLLRQWLRARHHRHGSIPSDASLQPELSSHNHWGFDKWKECLLFSAVKESLSILDADNDFQKRSAGQSSKAPKQRVRLPENEDEGLVVAKAK